MHVISNPTFLYCTVPVFDTRHRTGRICSHSGGLLSTFGHKNIGGSWLWIRRCSFDRKTRLSPAKQEPGIHARQGPVTRVSSLRIGILFSAIVRPQELHGGKFRYDLWHLNLQCQQSLNPRESSQTKDMTRGQVCHRFYPRKACTGCS